MTLTVGDLREESVAKELIDHTVKKYEGIDVLVNSAGILVTGSVEDTKVTEYDRQFDVNVRRYADPPASHMRWCYHVAI